VKRQGRGGEEAGEGRGGKGMGGEGVKRGLRRG